MAYRILGLDDDNHQPTFVTEVGIRYHGYRDIINYLAEPHLEPAKIKMFVLVDLTDDDLTLGQIDDETVDMMFDALATNANLPEGFSFDDCFDLFWNSDAIRK